MKNRNKIIGIGFLLMINSLSIAVDYNGDYYYQMHKYSKAIEQYEVEIANGNNEILHKLADCYEKVGNTNKAESIYKTLIDDNKHTNEDVYNYSRVLRTNGKFDESIEWASKYASLEPDDKRVKSLLENKTSLQHLFQPNSNYHVEKLSINNDDKADFSPAYIGDSQVAFVTTRSKTAEKQAWDNNVFYDIRIFDKTDEGLKLNKFKGFNKINSSNNEGPLCLSYDKKTIYFTRNVIREIDGKKVSVMNIFTAILENERWTDIHEVGIPHDEQYAIGHPAISPDGRTLYFTSNIAGGSGGMDLYKSIKSSAGKWGKPINLGSEINTKGNEVFPTLDPKGQFLFFSSNTHPGLGGLDVFVCDLKAPNLIIKDLGVPINSEKDDFSLTIATNGKEGYFSSNRPNGQLSLIHI